MIHSYAIMSTDALGDQLARRRPARRADVSRQRVGRAVRRGDDRARSSCCPDPGLDPVNLLELIESEQATCLLGVPTVWMALLAHTRAQGKKLDSVRKVTIGGSACPPPMIEEWEKVHGARVIHAWGMTEMSPVGTTGVLLPQHERLDDAARFAVKCKQGRPIFGVDLRIVDDDGKVIAHDGKTSGHLQVRGVWVASSYFKRERDETHHDGWFDTGDIANIDADGYVQITDRSKDVIKSGGEWISSIDLENAAMCHPCVQHAAAIGVAASEVAGAAAADLREGTRQGRGARGAAQVSRDQAGQVVAARRHRVHGRTAARSDRQGAETRAAAALRRLQARLTSQAARLPCSSRNGRPAAGR